MKNPLVRFGVAMDALLLRELDALAAERGCTRSELFRDLGRGEVGRTQVPKGVSAVGALTLVYDHHVRDLGERLTGLQHELGDDVRAALHVHLGPELCLEVVVMRGRSDRLQAIAERILAMRGVKHGGIQIIPGVVEPEHDHGHAPARSHGHAHAGLSATGTGSSRPSGPARGGRRASRVRSGSPGSRSRPLRPGRSRGG